MKFFETDLKGSYIIELEKLEDHRGFFTRIWDKKIFQDKGLNLKLVQTSFSFNKKRGTLRGMHFQKKPFEEEKLIRCIRGKIFDVIIDLRLKSSTYKKWISMELKSDDLKMIYIPRGFAHGFSVLSDTAVFAYKVDNRYAPESDSGIRYDDKSLGMTWDLSSDDIIVSDRDKELPNFQI